MNESATDTAIRIRKSAPNVESNSLMTGSPWRTPIEGRAKRYADKKTATKTAPIPSTR